MDALFRHGDVFFNGSHLKSSVCRKATDQILGQIINYGM